MFKCLRRADFPVVDKFCKFKPLSKELEQGGAKHFFLQKITLAVISKLRVQTIRYFL